jgi:DNA-binding response OmpR family regulator
MSWRPNVLVVARTPALGKTLFDWFTEAGYDVALVTSFSAAKAQLQTVPDLLVSEVRLGEYNGLHLAVRAQAQHVPCVVVGDPDAVLERDAQQMGVTYLTPELDHDYLIVLAAHLTSGATEEQIESKAPEKPTANLSFLSAGDFEPVEVPAVKWGPGENRRLLN